MAVINDVKALNGTDVPNPLGIIYTVTSPAVRESINLLRFHCYAAGATLTIQVVENGGSTGNTKIAISYAMALNETYVPAELIGEALDVGDTIHASTSVANSINAAMTVKRYTS